MADNKDFNSLLQDQSNLSTYSLKKDSLDPNIFPNHQMQSQINQQNQKTLVANVVSQTIVQTILYPLTAIYASLQMSVIPHQNKYGDHTPNSTTSLAKTTKDILPHEKRKFELILKSGVVGSNKPFRAPVYTSYIQVIKALSNQGFLAFYKGNFLSILHLSLNSQFKFQFLSQLDFSVGNIWHKGNQTLRQFLVFGLFTLAEIFTNPLMLFQSRFILQNRLPNFNLYPSIYGAFKKHLINKREYFQGSTVHIYKNAAILLAQLPINHLKSLEKHQLLYFFTSFNLINYPFLTILRRIHCQSKLPGMIPPRYSGTWHALRLITQEEGIKGLYRGFSLYMLQSCVTQYLMFASQMI